MNLYRNTPLDIQRYITSYLAPDAMLLKALHNELINFYWCKIHHFTLDPSGWQ